MAVVIEDLIVAAKRSVDINGVTRTRIHHVSELSGSDVFRDAEAAIGIFYNYPHPTEPNCFVQSITQDPFLHSKTQVKQTTIYRSPDFSNILSPRISFTGTTRDALTNFDADGTPIVVTYTSIGADGNPVINSEVGQINAPKSLGIYEVEQIESAIPSWALVAFNKLNSNPWNGGDRYTWWLRCINFWEILYQPGWRVRYTFEYDEETHLKISAFRNAYGIVPEDIDPVVANTNRQNGWVRSRPNGVYNFRSLQIPTIF